MHKARLEAFSDGVIAIIITIMVLELKVPRGHDLDSLSALAPVFAGYVLSFINVGIYWNNHHHLLQAASRVSGAVLWANLHLLFWLSLMPFTTNWMGENWQASVPVTLYGVDLLMCGLAYYILCQCLIASEGRDSALANAVGRDRKGIASIIIYIAAVATALVIPVLALAMYTAVAIMWLVPDRRIEGKLAK